MNRILALLLLLSATAWGANPAFQDFNGNQFGVNGNKVRLLSGVLLTNPVVNSGTLSGKINTGAVTNASGSRVAYFSDLGTVTATNSVFTNLISINNTYLSNAFITNIFATNAYITNLFATTEIVSNAYITNLFTTVNITSNLFATNIFTTNLFSSNIFTTNLVANNTYVSNAYITNLTVVNFSGLTNNTDIAGKVTGSGIGSNLTAYARLDAANIFSNTNNILNLGVPGTLGVGDTTTTALDVTGAIHGVKTNLQAIWDGNGFLTGTSVVAVANFIGPTNSATVGQVLYATSTAGATKWDYVNQVATNSTVLNADFNKPFSRFTTNAAFLWLSPANVDTTLTKLQVADVAVTNSTAAAILTTFNGTVRVTGTPYVTNVTYFHWRVDPWMTNCLCEPVF